MPGTIQIDMGRCYEFGPVITEGCDHAMVVSPEGGACVCGECGARCLGRFKACGPILAQPGYVPVTAPRHTAKAAAANVPVPLLGDSPAPAAPDLAMPAVERVAPASRPAEVPRMADIVPLFEALLDRPDRTNELVAQLRHELATRDDELGDAFDRLTEAHARIAEELAADREARERLVAAVETLSERLARIEDKTSRPLFGVRRTNG